MDPALRAIVAALRTKGMSDEVIQQAVTTAELTSRPLRTVLVDDQIVTEFQLACAIAEAYGVEAMELSNFPVDPTAMSRIPLTLARRHRMLPIAVNDTTITVAVGDPGDVLALDDIRAATGLVVRPLVVTKDDLDRLLDRYVRDSTDLDEAAAQIVADETTITNSDGLNSVNEDAPVVRYVNSLLERAITSRASDIHLEPSEHDLKIRLRIDGVLHEVDAVPRGIQAAMISRLKILSGLDITERRVPQNGRITKDLGGRSIDLRTATLPTVWGEKVVLRVLDTGGIDLELRKLGFTEINYSRFSTSFSKPHGMVLVTGPTGSGKSTTLYATLGEIARPEVNVITVEDPVEYRMDGINQVQVNVKAGLTFAAILPAILRSDPDVVLIGEIRDRATAQLAVEAALTGHLVLSTLHTNDAPSAMPRLVEMGIEPFLVGSSLDSVLAQRLSRRLCEWCKEAYDPQRRTWSARTGRTRTSGSRHSSGGRSAAGPARRPATGAGWRSTRSCRSPRRSNGSRWRTRRPVRSRRVAVAEGMVTLRDDGLRKTAEGLTSLEEVSPGDGMTTRHQPIQQ